MNFWTTTHAFLAQSIGLRVSELKWHILWESPIFILFTSVRREKRFANSKNTKFYRRCCEIYFLLTKASFIWDLWRVHLIIFKGIIMYFLCFSFLFCLKLSLLNKKRDLGSFLRFLKRYELTIFYHQTSWDFFKGEFTTLELIKFIQRTLNK